MECKLSAGGAHPRPNTPVESVVGADWPYSRLGMVWWLRGQKGGAVLKSRGARAGGMPNFSAIVLKEATHNRHRHKQLHRGYLAKTLSSRFVCWPTVPPVCRGLTVNRDSCPLVPSVHAVRECQTRHLPYRGHKTDPNGVALETNLGPHGNRGDGATVSAESVRGTINGGHPILPSRIFEELINVKSAGRDRQGLRKKTSVLPAAHWARGLGQLVSISHRTLHCDRGAYEGLEGRSAMRCWEASTPRALYVKNFLDPPSVANQKGGAVIRSSFQKKLGRR